MNTDRENQDNPTGEWTEWIEDRSGRTERGQERWDREGTEVGDGERSGAV